jgi:hypothetical protein
MHVLVIGHLVATVAIEIEPDDDDVGVVAWREDAGDVVADAADDRRRIPPRLDGQDRERDIAPCRDAGRPAQHGREPFEVRRHLTRIARAAIGHDPEVGRLHFRPGLGRPHR